MVKKYIIYILECSDGSLYIGKTLNVDKRIREHNGDLPNGAKYTRARRPVILKYTEEFKSSGEALKREYALKKLSRKEKVALISS